MSKDIDKSKVTDSFINSITTYDKNSHAQSLAAERLMELCKAYLPQNFKQVLEVGCGTGLFTKKYVSELKVEKLLLSDLSADLCEYTKSQVSSFIDNVELLIGDVESVELPSNCDLIISSSSFQWLDDLDSFLERCSSLLTDDGCLAFSMFVAGTMKEITELTGRGLRYYNKSQLIEILEKYCHIDFVEEKSNKLFYKTVKEIVKHIRDTGVGGGLQGTLTVAQYKQFERDYTAFATDRGLPVSYNSLFVIARKK